jgi:hypothetical protein
MLHVPYPRVSKESVSNASAVSLGISRRERGGVVCSYTWTANSMWVGYLYTLRPMRRCDNQMSLCFGCGFARGFSGRGYLLDGTVATAARGPAPVVHYVFADVGTGNLGNGDGLATVRLCGISLADEEAVVAAVVVVAFERVVAVVTGWVVERGLILILVDGVGGRGGYHTGAEDPADATDGMDGLDSDCEMGVNCSSDEQNARPRSCSPTGLFSEDGSWWFR